MKTFRFVLFLFLTSTFAIAQNENDKIVYTDSLWVEIGKQYHTHYNIITDYHLDLPEYQMTYFYKSGKIQMKGKITDKDQLTKKGTFVAYAENGNKISLINFVNSEPVGNFYSWYDNGTLKTEGEYLKRAKGDFKFVKEKKIFQHWTTDGKHVVVDGNGYYDDSDRGVITSGKITNGVKDSIWNGKTIEFATTFIETYKDGKLISGVSTDKKGNKYPYDNVFIGPKSKKGENDFNEHIRGNIRTEEINGRIILRFSVETDGSVSDVQVIQSLNKMYDDEATRIVRSYKHWSPAEIRGIKIRASYTLPITIR